MMNAEGGSKGTGIYSEMDNSNVGMNHKGQLNVNM